MGKHWETIESKVIFESPFVLLRKDVCRLPSGQTVDDFYVVDVPDGAAIVAITKQNELVLVQQYKHGHDDIVLELPAGNVEPNEDPADTIMRELLEETGYAADKIDFVETLITKPARMSAKTHIFFAKDVVKVAEAQKDDAETIEVVKVPLAQLPDCIRSRKIRVETSLASILLVWDRLGLS